jgi:hypothetical protein
VTSMYPPRVGDVVTWMPAGMKSSFPAKIVDHDTENDRFLLDAHVVGPAWVRAGEFQIGANN